MSQVLSTDVNELQVLIGGFTVYQIRYIAIRPFVKYDKEAAKKIGLAAETVSRWENKADVDKAVRLIALDGIIITGELFRRSLPKAANELVDELDHKRVDVRHRAAKEIIDRAMGKAAQPLTGKDGSELLPAETIVSALLAIRKGDE